MIKLRLGRVGGVDITRPSALELVALALVLIFVIVLVLLR
jgi:hypothetical protein